MCHLTMFINDPGMFGGSCHVANAMQWPTVPCPVPAHKERKKGEELAPDGHPY